MGSAVAFCLYYLAQNQEVQKRCLEEMDRIFEGADRQSTLNDLREMTYLEQCVKETLRLVPSVAMFAREISEDVVLGMNVEIIVVDRREDLISKKYFYTNQTVLESNSRYIYTGIHFRAPENISANIITSFRP